MHWKQSRLLRHVLGQYSYDDVNMLKEILGVEELDLVVLDSVDEFLDLLAEEGIPLARRVKPTEPESLA